MKYKSTRGGQENLTFEEVLFSTYAIDGGLYVPTYVPLLTQQDLLLLSTYSFPQVAAHIMHLYSGIGVHILRDMMTIAFSQFNTAAATPTPLPLLPLTDNITLLDLSLGPTMAFKDIVSLVSISCITISACYLIAFQSRNYYYLSGPANRWTTVELFRHFEPKESEDSRGDLWRHRSGGNCGREELSASIDLLYVSPPPRQCDSGAADDNSR